MFLFFLILFTSIVSQAGEYNFDKDYYPYPQVVNYTKKLKPKTIVLLIQGEKKNTSVRVQNHINSAILNEPNQYVYLYASDIAPSIPKMMSLEDINATFGQLLSIEPEKMLRYTIYFQSNTITPDSQESLMNIIKTLQDRKDLYITIIGHSDTKGSTQLKDEISKKRAEYVAQKIKESGISYESMKVNFYGDNDLAIFTNQNVSERLNRRVEILIR